MVPGIVVTLYGDGDLHIFYLIVYYFHINIALGFELIVFGVRIGSQTEAFEIPFYQRRGAFGLISAVVQASVTLAFHVQLDSESIFMVYRLLHCNFQPCLFSLGCGLDIQFFLGVSVFAEGG